MCNVYLDKDVTDVKVFLRKIIKSCYDFTAQVEWENKANCPDKTYTIAKEKCQVSPDEIDQGWMIILICMYFVQVIEYYEQPDSLKCGKLMKISAKVREKKVPEKNILHYCACRWAPLSAAP